MEIVVVTLMALIFGARESTGLMVPLLIAGDIFAVVYYHRYTRWGFVIRFLPWMLAGLLIGVLLGRDLPETAFKVYMVAIIMGSVVMMYWWDRKKSRSIPTHWAFAGFMGVMAGITTMIGNLAGAFSNIYFLAMKLPKNQFIGTAAWLFLIINICKLPFHLFVWHTISVPTLKINLVLLPGVCLGLIFGIYLVKIIKEVLYRRMILLLTAIGALLILLR